MLMAAPMSEGEEFEPGLPIPYLAPVDDEPV